MTPVPPPAAGALPAAGDRHLIENALALYCRAMDEHDAATAGQLLAHASLHFKDQPPRAGADAITNLYASAFQIPAPTRHLISNLVVQAHGQNIVYQTRYQRWSLAGPHPYCEGLGTYQGLFTPTPTGLIWTEHRITQD